MTGLKLAQRGDHVETTFTAPKATTGGARLGVLDIEILRAEAAGDFLKAARRSRRKAAPGESLSESSPLPAVGTTVRVAARALDRGRSSTVSSVVALTVQSPPPSPHDLVAELKPEAVALRWEGTIPPPPPSPSPSPSPSPGASPRPATPAPSTKGSASPRPTVSPSPSPSPNAAPAASPSPASAGAPAPGASSPAASPSPSPTPTPTPPPVTRGFLIYRRADPSGSYGGPIRSEPFVTNAFEDRTVSIGQRWCYVIAAAVSTEPVVESARSNEACVSVRDIVPPASPIGVAALGGADGIEVSWTPSTDADLASYRVYREAPGSPRERVGQVAPPETSFKDTAAAAGGRYVYTVTAVDRAGNESKPSAPAPGERP